MWKLIENRFFYLGSLNITSIALLKCPFMPKQGPWSKVQGRGGGRYKVPNSRFQILDPGFEIRTSGFESWDSRFEIRDPGLEIRNSRFRFTNPNSQYPAPTLKHLSNFKHLIRGIWTHMQTCHSAWKRINTHTHIYIYIYVKICSGTSKY